jgi:hypothetical protein
MERAIRTLFTSGDLSLVKAYLVRQWAKILSGNSPLGCVIHHLAV